VAQFAKQSELLWESGYNQTQLHKSDSHQILQQDADNMHNRHSSVGDRYTMLTQLLSKHGKHQSASPQPCFAAAQHEHHCIAHAYWCVYSQLQ
jgi:hypothetical protein